MPGKENVGWSVDTLADLPSKPISSFDLTSLNGKWYKVMGLDSRYDCFDCQKNSFEVKDKSTLKMEALFRIPRPTKPGYMQSKIVEELHASTDSVSAPSSDNKMSLAVLTPQMQSKGQMFGLTFWENWYILGESKPPSFASSFLSAATTPPFAMASSSIESAEANPELKLVYYTGHTLQGSYKGTSPYK